MAAGTTYKGLTIRIGADTSQFTAGLARINAAASTTQGQLRRLTTALKLDPTSLGAARQQVSALGTLSTDTAQKMRRLSDSMGELGRQRLLGDSTRTVAQLATDTRDAQSAAQGLQEAYNAVTTELANTYNHIESITGVKIDMESLSESSKGYADNIARLDKYLSQYGMTSEDVIVSTEDLAELFAEKGAITQEEAEHVKALRKNFDELGTSMADMRKAAQFQDTASELEQLAAQAKSFARQMVEANSASDFSKMTIGIRTADAELKILDAALADVDRRLAVVNDGLKLDPHNVTLAAQKAELLAEKEELAGKRAETLRAKLAEYDASGIGKVAAETDNVSESLARTREEAVKANQKVAVLSGTLRELRQRQSDMDAMDTNHAEAEYVELAAQIKRVEAELRKASEEARLADEAYDTSKAVSEYRKLQEQLAKTSAEADNVGTTAKTSGESLSRIGYGLYTTVTPLMRTIAQSAIQSAEDIDSAYRDMRKTVDGTESQFEDLKTAAITFSQTHVTSADQILEIEAMGGQLGIAAGSLEAFAETISNIGIATNIDVDTAAQNVGQLANIMSDLKDSEGKMDTTAVERFSDALVRLGNTQPALESDIMDVTTRIAGMGNIMGMSSTQVLAWSTAVVATGQNSEAAGTALSKTMSDIESAVSAGGDDLQAFADVAGMTADEFAASWGSDASGTLQAFVEGLKRIDDEGGSVDGTLESLGITSVRQKQALEGLSQTTNVLADSLGQAQDAWDNGGDAASEAEKKAEGFSGALQILKNNAQVMGSELADTVAPAIKALADLTGEATGVFASLPGPVKGATVAFMGVAGAIGPVLVAYKAIKDASDTFAGSDLAVVKAARSMGSSFSNFATKIGMSTTALGLAVGALAILGGVLYTAYTSAEEAKREQEEFNQALRDADDAAKSSASLETYTGTLEDVGEAAQESAQSVSDFREQFKRYAETQKDIADSAQSNVGQLNAAATIVDEFAGKTDLSTEAQGRLAWALKVLNDQLNLNLTAQDVMNGTYEDADGKVQNLKQSIDQLVEAKKRDAQMDAISGQLSNAYEEQAVVAKQLVAAEEDYNKALDERVQNMLDSPFNTYTEEQARAIAAEALSTQDLGKAYADAQAAMDSVNGEIEDLTEGYGTLATATDESASAEQRAVASLSALDQEYVKQHGTLSQFADKLKAVGLTEEQLAGITEEQWGQIARTYDGTSESIVAALIRAGVAIDDYDAKPLDSKTAEAYVDDNTLVDAQGNLYTWNGSTLVDQDGNAAVDDTLLTDAQGHVYKWNHTTLDDKKSVIGINGLDDLRTAIALMSAWNNKKLESKYATATAKFTQNAAGGIRYHADGAIATRAVPLDIVGEAGAEAIVPLTNRKYSQPFVDLIAEGVEKRIGTGQQAVVYNVYLDDVRVNDDMQIREGTKEYLTMLARKGNML